MNRREILGAMAASTLMGGWAAADDDPAGFTGERSDGVVWLRNPDGKPVLRYVHEKLPEGEKGPSVEGACFTHPIYTPGGDQVTDMAPADHPHHRGVFCGWVKVEGEETGDWWGWGALAPKDGRLVLNREARITGHDEKSVTLRLVNAWRAGAKTVLRERLTLTASAAPGCHVADFDYKFQTDDRQDVVLAQNPFGGFCYRARPRGELTVTGPGGVVDRPDSVFNKAETNWPASRWYDLSYRQPDGMTSGVAVMDHPSNPLSTWHGVRSLHMLNPCIVAGEPFALRFGEPLYLRYRLVAHDGAAGAVDLNDLFEAFAGSEER